MLEVAEGGDDLCDASLFYSLIRRSTDRGEVLIAYLIDSFKK